MRATMPSSQLLEPLGDVVAFHLRERANVVCGLNGRRRRAQFGRQVIDANAIRPRKREGPLQSILQFAHVSWPRVPQQQIRRFGRKSRRFLSESFCGSCEELPRNRQNVVTPFAAKAAP